MVRRTVWCGGTGPTVSKLTLEIGGRVTMASLRSLRLTLPVLLGLAIAFAVAVPVAAQVYVGVPPPRVSAVDIGPSNVSPVSVRGVGVGSSRGSSWSLALTGGDILGLGALALAFLGAGIALTRLARRPSPS
jgi:hypothetical protein